MVKKMPHLRVLHSRPKTAAAPPSSELSAFQALSKKCSEHAEWQARCDELLVGKQADVALDRLESERIVPQIGVRLFIRANMNKIN